MSPNGKLSPKLGLTTNVYIVYVNEYPCQAVRLYNT